MSDLKENGTEEEMKLLAPPLPPEKATLTCRCPQAGSSRFTKDASGNILRGVDKNGNPIIYLDIYTPQGLLPVPIPHDVTPGEKFEVDYIVRMPSSQAKMNREGTEEKSEASLPVAIAEYTRPMISSPPVPKDAQCNICGKGPNERADMIRPCNCAGYVHRKCLDNWRATQPNAFTKCQLCNFKYIFEQVTEKEEDEKTKKCKQHKFRALVARDVIFVFLGIQLIIVGLAVLIWLLDGKQHFGDAYEREKFPDKYQCDEGSLIKFFGCPRYFGKSFYYACGLIVFLFTIGFTAMTSYFCCSGENACGECCSQSGCSGCYWDSWDCFYLWYCCSGNGGGNSYYSGSSSGCQLCCESCQCADASCSNAGNCNCGDCDGGGGGDAAAFILMFFLVVAVIVVAIFVVIGVWIVLFAIVSAIQRILQKHMHVLQKRELCKKWVVEDQAGRLALDKVETEYISTANPVSVNDNLSGVQVPAKEVKDVRATDSYFNENVVISVEDDLRKSGITDW